jgi:hypothetical protein
MHGLINKAIQCFVLDTYGRETWREMAQSAALPVMQFEAMLIYEDTLTEQALDATARFLDKPRTDVLEDIGTYLASHPNVEALRRLLRFGGAHFIEFLYSLDDLHDRARLAVDDLELPRLTLVRHTEHHYSLLCGAAFPGWGHVLVGILRVMADDYGALACLEHCGAKDQTETIDIRLVHTSYAQGRTFVLGQQPV